MDALTPIQATMQNPAIKAPITKERAKFEQAAKEFEGLFISEMIKPMFEGLDTNGPFGGGRGEEVFRGLMIQEYGKIIAGSGGVGLSSQIRDQLIKMQEQANHGAVTQP